MFRKKKFCKGFKFRKKKNIWKGFESKWDFEKIGFRRRNLMKYLITRIRQKFRRCAFFQTFGLKREFFKVFELRRKFLQMIQALEEKNWRGKFYERVELRRWFSRRIEVQKKDKISGKFELMRELRRIWFEEKVLRGTRVQKKEKYSWRIIDHKIFEIILNYMLAISLSYGNYTLLHLITRLIFVRN